MLLEDYSFCYRWSTKMDRPLWVCVDELVKHLGDFSYGAKYDYILQQDLLLANEARENAAAGTAGR